MSDQLKQAKDLKIGDPIWIRDVDHRRSFNERTQWKRATIVGETTRSWLWKRPDSPEWVAPEKLPKTLSADGDWLRREKFCFSQLEVEQRKWVERHRHAIIKETSWCRDYDTLRVIASAINYDETQERD